MAENKASLDASQARRDWNTAIDSDKRITKKTIALGGQIARTIDGTRRTTYADKNNQIPDSIERSL